jgi:hypothetical protein
MTKKTISEKQAYAMAQVCLDLHDALGCKWGDNPYLTISQLKAAAQPAPVQDLPFGVGGGLVAIKTLLGRDPCVHANTAIEMIDAILKEHPVAQPAVQEGRDWSLLEATQESLREHMAEIKRLKAAQLAPVQEPVAQSLKDAVFTVIEGFNIPHDVRKILESAYYNAPPAPQPVPVKTYHDGKPWPVAPKPWVGLTETEVEAYDSWADFQVGCGRQTLFDMVRDIEAKLKGKNHDQ